MFNYTDRPAKKSRGGEGPLHVAPRNDPTNTALAGWVGQRVTTRVLSINFDTTMSPTSINHVGLGFSRFRNPFISVTFEQGWTQPDGGKLGLKGVQYDLFPLVRFETDNYAWYGARSAADNFFNTFTARTVTLSAAATPSSQRDAVSPDNYRLTTAAVGRSTTGVTRPATRRASATPATRGPAPAREAHQGEAYQGYGSQRTLDRLGHLRGQTWKSPNLTSPADCAGRSSPACGPGRTPPMWTSDPTRRPATAMVCSCSEATRFRNPYLNVN
jgi:hypothetical protein